MTDRDDPFETVTAAGWRRVRTSGAFMSGAGQLWARRCDADWAYAVWATQAHLNPAGVVHGGLLATLADHAISTVAWEAAGRVPCVTVQLDMHYLAAVAQGVLLEARAHLVRRTSSLLFMRCVLRVADREVAAAQALMKMHPVPRD